MVLHIEDHLFLIFFFLIAAGAFYRDLISGDHINGIVVLAGRNSIYNDLPCPVCFRIPVFIPCINALNDERVSHQHIQDLLGRRNLMFQHSVRVSEVRFFLRFNLSGCCPYNISGNHGACQQEYSSHSQCNGSPYRAIDSVCSRCGF